jgi:hypothetical protein
LLARRASMAIHTPSARLVIRSRTRTSYSCLNAAIGSRRAARVAG